MNVNKIDIIRIRKCWEGLEEESDTEEGEEEIENEEEEEIGNSEENKKKERKMAEFHKGMKLSIKEQGNNFGKILKF